MIHGQTPETMRKDQDFPVSIEVQFLGGDGTNPRTTANLCTPGTNVVYGRQAPHPPLHQQFIERHYHGDQWVTAEIEVHGNKVIRHKINGKTVLEYTEPQLDERDADGKRCWTRAQPKMISGGTISLQSESHPVEFRKVELRELTE